MSSDKKNASGQGGEHTQLMLVGAILTFAIFAKVWPIIHAFYNEHRITIILFLWIVGISSTVTLIVWLWNSYVKRCHEESVIEPDESAVYLGKEIK